MAKNALRPEQDLLTRDFYLKVARDPNILPTQPTDVRKLKAILLDILGYTQLPNGALVDKNVTIRTVSFGKQDYDKYPDEWIADRTRVEKEYADELAFYTSDTFDSCSGKSPQSDPVGDVLQQKVQDMDGGRCEVCGFISVLPQRDPAIDYCLICHTPLKVIKSGGSRGGWGQLREGSVRLDSGTKLHNGRQVDNDCDLEKEISSPWDGGLYPDNHNG